MGSCVLMLREERTLTMPRAYYGGMNITAVVLIGLGVMLSIWQL